MGAQQAMELPLAAPAASDAEVSAATPLLGRLDQLVSVASKEAKRSRRSSKESLPKTRKKEKTCNHRSSSWHLRRKLRKSAQGVLRSAASKLLLVTELVSRRPSPPDFGPLLSCVKQLFGCRRRRRIRQVRFESSVQVRCYKRLVGGSDGVPSDGASIALGLGAYVRDEYERLIEESPDGPRALAKPMPCSERELLLRASMSDARYHRLQFEQRRTMGKLRAQRFECNAVDSTTICPLAESVEDAVHLAALLREEVRRNAEDEVDVADQVCDFNSPAMYFGSLKRAFVDIGDEDDDCISKRFRLSIPMQ